MRGLMYLLVFGFVAYWLLQYLHAYIMRVQQTRRRSAPGGDRPADFTARQEGSTTHGHASVPLDPWQVLQVRPGASAEEIHAAYKRLLMQYHPDRVAHLGEEFQQLAHRKVLAIQKAYAMLTHR